MELPPRARRKEHHHEYVKSGCGTTSACAEKSISGRFLLAIRRNYLRVRGEKTNSPALLLLGKG
ncbi:Hypothetical protein Cp262_2184 [Corynebacterium pseudotuberculosis]|nr:Hypothetical protein Cp262_2184 [Corynebacterium pseudotuberculosis]